MPLTSDYELSPREMMLMEAEKEERGLARDHSIAIKNLEIELAREDHKAEIKLKELEAKWATWLKLPRTILLLPVLVLFGIAYVCSMFTKKEMPRRFWDLLL